MDEINCSVKSLSKCCLLTSSKLIFEQEHYHSPEHGHCFFCFGNLSKTKITRKEKPELTARNTETLEVRMVKKPLGIFLQFTRIYNPH